MIMFFSLRYNKICKKGKEGKPKGLLYNKRSEHQAAVTHSSLSVNDKNGKNIMIVIIKKYVRIITK